METIKTQKVKAEQKAANPIVKMIADKKKIAKAIENGEHLSTLKDVKIVSPV